MASRVPVPNHLVGRIFRTDAVDHHGLRPGRLRSPDLDRPYHGVRSSNVETATPVQYCRAYTPLLGEHRVFSHTTAAQLFGMPLPARHAKATPIHVATIGGTRPRGVGVVGHELIAGTARSNVRGLPVVTPEHAWCQLASVLQRDELVAAGDFLISGSRRVGGSRTTPLCTIGALHRAVRLHSRQRGVRPLRWALPLVRFGVDSPAETKIRLQIIAAGLPEPVIAHPIRISAALILHPDLAYPEFKIAIEYEGDEHRTDKNRWRRDIRRRQQMEDAGWVVIRATGDDLNDASDLVAAITLAISRRQSQTTPK